MPRIAQKEINVNHQMRMQLSGVSESSNSEPLFVYDPGWGSRYLDPHTGIVAILYDHVSRNMKFSGGIQIRIMVPRYQLEDKSELFRVLPPNLCVFKHYVEEVIQEVIEEAVEEILEEVGPKAGTEIQSDLSGGDGENDRPCERTKWLWKLWFFKNMILIEAILRLLVFFAASRACSSASTLQGILFDSDYLKKIMEDNPDDWLKVVIRAAWNSGMPLIPLRDCLTIRDVLAYIRVQPIQTP